LEIDKSARVDTAWDLGRTDSTAIWFIQQVGREYRIVDYYETSGVAMHHYADVLFEKKYQHKWRYGRHYFPTDVKQREWLSEKSRVESLNSLGIEPEVVPEQSDIERINAVRRTLDRSLIDPVRCARGLEALRNCVREWSIGLRDWRVSPKHDWALSRCRRAGYICDRARGAKLQATFRASTVDAGKDKPLGGLTKPAGKGPQNPRSA